MEQKKSNTFGAPDSLEDGLVTKSVLPTLHDQCEPVVDVIMALLLQKSQKQQINTESREEKESRWF